MRTIRTPRGLTIAAGALALMLTTGCAANVATVGATATGDSSEFIC